MIVEKKYIHTEGGKPVTVVYIEGLIRLGRSAEVAIDAIENILQNTADEVIVDLRNIDYVESTGIGELVVCFGRLTNKRTTPVLVNTSERIKRLLEVAKLDESFGVFASEEEALSSFDEREANAG